MDNPTVSNAESALQQWRQTPLIIYQSGKKRQEQTMAWEAQTAHDVKHLQGRLVLCSREVTIFLPRAFPGSADKATGCKYCSEQEPGQVSP